MGFERSVLPSGIRVVCERMPGQRSVAVGAWVNVGSRDEPAELCGVTHFLEHLVFKGTTTRSALEIAQTFDAIGGDLNAFTTKEVTCFHSRTLAADLPLAVETIGDLCRNARIDADDVESERSVVVEEIAMHEDTPDDIVFDLFQESFWPDQALGRRVQGTEDTVRAMSRDAIDEHYRSRYGEIVVGAAGDVDHARLCDLVASSIEGRAATTARAGVVPRAVPQLSVEERDTEQSHLVYGAQGFSRTDARRWTVAVLNVAIGGGMSSRLFQEIREKRGLAYAVSSGHQGFADTGVYQVYAGCSPEHVGEVLRIARDQLGEVAAHGIDEAELARAVGHLRGATLLSLDDPSSLASYLGKAELVEHEILTAEEMIAKIEAVTLDDARRVAAELLGGPWALTVLGPAFAADVSGFVGRAA
jgi:predicted Zn-dependent peptidase